MPDIHRLLHDMLDAYEAGEAEGQVHEFIAGWATTIAPPATGDTPELEVLVTGDPFDGLSIQGPYPRGFLGDCDITINDTWWIVNLGEPTIQDS